MKLYPLFQNGQPAWPEDDASQTIYSKIYSAAKTQEHKGRARFHIGENGFITDTGLYLIEITPQPEGNSLQDLVETLLKGEDRRFSRATLETNPDNPEQTAILINPALLIKLMKTAFNVSFRGLYPLEYFGTILPKHYQAQAAQEQQRNTSTSSLDGSVCILRIPGGEPLEMTGIVEEGSASPVRGSTPERDNDDVFTTF